MMALSIEELEAERLRYERKELESELNRWGKWIEERLPHEQGWRSMDNVESYLRGAGGGEGGHRILCLDMPVHIYAVHGRVLRLPQGEQWAIWFRYVFRTKEDGTLWNESEKCLFAGVQHQVVRELLISAKDYILGVKS